MTTDFSTTIFRDGIRLHADSSNLGTSSYLEVDSIKEVEHSSVQEWLDSTQDIYSNLTASYLNTFRPPGTGPISVLFEIGDKVYVVRDADDGLGGKLYTTTDLEDLSKEVEWEEVDIGYEVEYENGAATSFTVYDKDFLDSDNSDIDPRKDLLGSSASSSSNSDHTTPPPRGDWESPSSALEDTKDTTARAWKTLDDTADLDVWYSTETLKLTGFDVGDSRPTTATVVGVEAEVVYKYNSSLGQDRDKLKARMASLTLANVGGSDSLEDSSIKSADTDFDQFYTYTAGGPTSTWNASNLSTNNVFDSDFGINISFEFIQESGGGLDQRWFGVFVHVAYIKLSVYFEGGDERIYFWDGSSDIAEADLVHLFKREGHKDVETAEGVLNIANSTNIANISVGDTIRTAANGAGALLGEVVSIDEARFPTSTSMEEENSFSQVIKENFYLDEDKEAVYGCTGAGPAFRFDGTYFSHLRIPVAEDKDKPRHIAKHGDHLVLGYSSGSILVSVAGDPSNFEGVEGASEWGFGDRITGLLPLKGSALGIFCQNSTHALAGKSLNSFTTQDISRTSGAIEYSVEDIGQPIYADYSGIASISNTEQYGDFNFGKLSYAIGPFIERRLQDTCGICSNVRGIVASVKVRNKGQYKLFFGDGLILTMTIPDFNEGTPMFTWQDFSYRTEEPDDIDTTYVPSAIVSTVLSSGRELVVLGTREGDVYIYGENTGILQSNGILPYDAYLVFNPFNGDAPINNLKYSEIHVHGLYSGYQELSGSAGVNYLRPVEDPRNDTQVMGSLQDPINLEKVPGSVTFHLPSVTAGYSLRIDSQAIGNLIHTIQMLTYRVAPSSLRTSNPKR